MTSQKVSNLIAYIGHKKNRWHRLTVYAMMIIEFERMDEIILKSAWRYRTWKFWTIKKSSEISDDKSNHWSRWI